MADSYITQTFIGLSTAPESTFGALPVLGSLYTSVLTRARILPLPNIRKTDDTGIVGRGSSSMYATYTENEVTDPINIEFSYMVNVNSFLLMLRRFTGKTMVSGDVTVVEASVAWKKRFIELDPDISRQLPSSAIVYRNNGADFVHGGCVGSSLNISQTGSQDPAFTMNFLNGGLYKRIRDITSPAFGALSTYVKENRMKGAETRVGYTDADGTVSLVVPNRRLRQISFSAANNLDVSDERSGLPRIDDTVCPDKGWYRDYLLFDDRTISSQFRVMIDDDMREWKNVIGNKDVTNFTWDMKGYCIASSLVNTQNQLSLIMPYCGFRSPQGGEDSNKAIKDITVFPMIPENKTHYGVYRFEATTGGSNAIIS